MSLDNVGATGNEPKKPGMITEAAVKKELARREAINADPTQRPNIEESPLKNYSKEDLDALLKSDYREQLNAKFTDFNENVYNDAKLQKSKYSTDVTDLLTETEKVIQQRLEEVAAIDFEADNKMWNGELALPIDTDKLDQKLALIDESVRDVEETKEKTFSGTDEEAMAMKAAVKQIDDKMLKKMVRVSDFDDGQKETLKTELEKAYGMTLPELAKEFGITVDLSKIKNLGDKETEQADNKEKVKRATPEEVAGLLKVYEEILETLPKEADLKNFINAEKNNMLYLIGNENDKNSKGVVQKFEEARYTEIAAGRDKDPKNKNYKKLCAQLKDAQDSEIKTYIKYQKALLLNDAMTAFRANIIEKHKNILEDTDREVQQGLAFREKGVIRSIDLKKDERDDYRIKVKEVKKTGKASSKAAGKIGSAGGKDKDKTVYSGDPDANVKTKVGDKATIYDQKIEAENKAKEEKRKAGYYKNFGHINQYIFDCLKGAADGKEISRAEAKELRDLLGEYTLDYADKLELIADYVKVDDQSGVAIDKKAKTKVSIETDHSQIDPKKLKFILEKVKDMDLKLDTTEQKAEAKEQIEKLLEEFKEDPKE